MKQLDVATCNMLFFGIPISPWPTWPLKVKAIDQFANMDPFFGTGGLKNREFILCSLYDLWAHSLIDVHHIKILDESIKGPEYILQL